MDLDPTSGEARGAREGGGAPHPTGRTPLSRGPHERPLIDFFHLYISIYPENIQVHHRSGVPPPQASVATKNQSGPCSGTLPEGRIITGGHFIILALSMSRRE